MNQFETVNSDKSTHCIIKICPIYDMKKIRVLYEKWPKIRWQMGRLPKLEYSHREVKLVVLLLLLLPTRSWSDTVGFLPTHCI
jgi:hypothetical protein